jgi:glucoside 3-dehydrogenase (cytochrome c) hitch-hiker subunit
MNRRDFLQCAALLAAGTTVVPSAWAMNHEQKTFLAARPNYIDSHPLTFFTDAQRSAIAAIADQIIPRTQDSPGALDAGASRFIELMVADWFNTDERKIFMDGLAELQQRAAGDFARLSAAEQLQQLEALEEEAGDTAWYQLGSTLRIWDDTAPFICQVKELTVLGFMLSKVGREQFLRENPMGQFKGDVPLATDDPAYAPELPLRLMTRD